MVRERQPSLHPGLTAGGAGALITDSGGRETLNMEQGQGREGDGHFGIMGPAELVTPGPG